MLKSIFTFNFENLRKHLQTLGFYFFVNKNKFFNILLVFSFLTFLIVYLYYLQELKEQIELTKTAIKILQKENAISEDIYKSLIKQINEFYSK